MTPEAPSTHARRSPLDGVRVLFADESSDERSRFRARFGGACAVLVCVSSADEALEILGWGEIDLLVTELHSTGCDGLELVRRMRDLPPDISGAVPAIAVRAGIRTESTRVLPWGFVGAVVKPYEDCDLLAVVADASMAIAALRRLRACRRIETPAHSELGKSSREKTSSRAPNGGTPPTTRR